MLLFIITFLGVFACFAWFSFGIRVFGACGVNTSKRGTGRRTEEQQRLDSVCFPPIERSIDRRDSLVNQHSVSFSYPSSAVICDFCMICV
ncbi:uncharacterized protein B0T23DRAFT_12955 [Neurospora hispaniola]|uniref:Uncharacterized protein n=1 Tax=Neurospora hispaniola TaxID=588809 RepID=A0AAJ0IF82_9PEZI|nr:hypothetical protein B0T23DRAFT_12955 [Neurospora hispaniola]